MSQSAQRIAINIGSGYLPGLDLVVAGAASAANGLGWEIVGIRDGYDGLLFPGRYPAGGTVKLGPEIMDSSGHGRSVIGGAARTDPFRVRTIDSDNRIEEIDRSDDLLEALRADGIDAV